MTKEKTVFLILRVGLAFSFFYASVASFFDPSAWIGFFPLFIRVISDAALLGVWGVFQILLGVWLLVGWRAFYASIAAALSLFFVIIFNLSVMDIIFRDISILAIAVALTIYYAPKRLG